MSTSSYSHGLKHEGKPLHVLAVNKSTIPPLLNLGTARLKCDGTRAETRFGLSAKRTSPFKLAGGGSVQSTTGSRGVRISGSNGSNAGYTVL